MKRISQCIVASLVPSHSLTPDLDRLIQMILTIFAKADFQQRGVTFDCDDLVYLDFDAIRIAVMVREPDYRNPKPEIAIGVGHGPGHPGKPTVLYEKLAKKLVSIIAPRVDAQAVLWCYRDGTISAAVLDDILEEAEAMREGLEQQAQLHADQPASQHVAPIAQSEPTARHMRPPACETSAYTPQASTALTPEQEQEARLDALRQFLIEEQNDAATSSLMQASIFVMSSTLLLVAPPLGATLFTYCALRNAEDLNFDDGIFEKSSLQSLPHCQTRLTPSLRALGSAQNMARSTLSRLNRQFSS